MYSHFKTKLFLLACLCFAPQSPVVAQTISVSEAKSLVPYLDQERGITVDAAVKLALENNGELSALRKEIEAAQALVRQAGLRANPGLEISGARQTPGRDNNLMLQGSLPLELGGRRAARIRVADSEARLKTFEVADRERLLAAEVRAKFGEALAAAYKLKFAEEMLELATKNYNLISATVDEGRRAPLERSMELVELNRLRAIRETTAGAVEIKFLELRNILGKKPEDPLLLRGDFANLLETLPPKPESTESALKTRPDLEAARALEQLASARIEQARAEGKIDARLTGGYQRMNSGFPVSGFDDAGILRPVQSVFNFVTFGVMLDLPIRNRNQGMIAAAIADEDAARRRREFGELVIRREIAVGYARFESAARAMEIYRVGVREQAAANLSVVRQVYDLGEKPLFDLIAEQRRFVEIENGFIDAELETYLARVEILRAINSPELQNK